MALRRINNACRQFFTILGMMILLVFYTISVAYAAEKAEAAEKKHVQPIMSPPNVPIGPIMPSRRSAEQAVLGPAAKNEPGFFARQWARLRQFSIEESPATEQ